MQALTAALIMACALVSTSAAGDDWNLFAAHVVESGPPTCVEDWLMFEPPYEARYQPDCDVWNLFASAQTADVVSDAAAAVLSRHEGTHVLLFTSTSCAPCVVARDTLKPLIEAKRWPVHEIEFAKDSDAFEALGVERVPTFVAVRRGVECGRLEGADRKALYAMLRRANAVELPPQDQMMARE